MKRSYEMIKTVVAGGLVLALAMGLASCSGGGGGSAPMSGGANPTGTALVVAEKVSVVDAQQQQKPQQKQNGMAGLLGVLFAGMISSDLPAASDYVNDKVSVYVGEHSTEAFSIVNEILCMMRQTRYDSMVNTGAYRAQVDMNLCSSERSSASSAGEASQDQSSSASMPRYEFWTVDSSRMDNASPHIVKVWVHEKAEGQFDKDKTIFVKIAITEGMSDTNPYGLFTLSFAGKDAQTGATMFKGYLKTERDPSTGKVLLKFANEETNNAFRQYATLDKDPGSSAGAGKLAQYENWDGNPSERHFDIAFNAGFFLRDDGVNPAVCLDRDQFDESAWRYALYNSDGTRVARNSGFSIKSGSGAYGWVGYWGMWFPQGVSIGNGAQVYRLTYGPNGTTETPYTVMKAGGKLKKHTRNQFTLADIKNIPLNWNESDGQGGWTNYQVLWTDDATINGVNGLGFYKVAQQNQATWTFEGLNPAVPFDMNAVQWGDINFWSQALNGQVRVKRTGCIWDNDLQKTVCNPSANSDEVVFYAEDIVYPDEFPGIAAFTCFDNCPNADASGVNTETPILMYNGAGYQYAFDPASMLLKYNGNAVVLTEEIPSQQWGVMSGPLFDPAAIVQSGPNAGMTYQELLACEWDPNQTCGWKAWSELPMFYTWETGLNDWNKFTALKNGNGAVLKFDPPLQVEYVHHEAGGKYDGVKFYLEYSGFGDLHGIPGKCVDMNTGNDTDCSQGGNTIRWVPAIMIPDVQADDSLTEVAAGAESYFVKALEKEQRMKEDVSGGCAALSFGDYTLPDMSEWTAPDIGSEPDVNGAPAVIGGVVQ